MDDLESGIEMHGFQGYTYFRTPMKMGMGQDFL